ncbi:MAG: winged helix-turn-helix transcriptional regulator [Candidatus Heimdallarchaeota archaeon]|nr:winged helix-turn-helix transcriptional regulator [Candidatus Heimdallarchaeota archaeon]
MVIEERDLELLIALQEYPLAPASKLAKSVNLSTPTVITRLELLKKDKSYYNVFANLLPDTLDLEIVDVLIEIDSIENVEYFEKHICYNHPYTLFRIRCFGNFNGLYVQFRIPKNSLDILLDLLNYLKKEKKIRNYIIPITPSNTETVYTKANLKNWEAKLMRWNFDWNAWIQKMASVDSKRILKTPGKSLLQKLDALDIALLQELTMGARRKNTALMDSLKLDRTTVGLQQKISRKVKYLEEEIISQYMVFLRWEAFEIYNSFLVHCDCEEKTTNKLQNLLIKDPIPFESTFKITENGFLWYLRCPASHFSDISAIIWSLSKKVKLYYLDYKKSEFYGLWKGAFDSSNHKWSTELMKKEKML